MELSRIHRHDWVIADHSVRVVKPYFGFTTRQAAAVGLTTRAQVRRRDGRLVAIEADPRYPPFDTPSGNAQGGPELEVLARVAGRWEEA
jgi:hypothetical protein